VKGDCLHNAGPSSTTDNTNVAAVTNQALSPYGSSWNDSRHTNYGET